MRIRRISLPGFGCLRGFQCELAPGLNLFFGENEAGKSTLQQAVLALLYGFYDHNQARPAETERHQRFRPWNGGDYRGLLEYELADGRRYEVRRDFSTTDIPTQLIDLTSGRDIAPELGLGRHGNVPFARRHLGMGRAVFESCAFISQGEVFQASRGAKPEEVGDAIASLADSAGRDVSAAQAMQRLQDFIRTQIGSERARTTALPTAREKLRAARQELEALEAAREAIAQKAAELDDLQARLSRLEEEIARTEVLLLRAQIRGLTARLDQVREAEAAEAEAQTRQEGLRAYASVPHHLRDEVLALRVRRQEALRALSQAGEELSALSSQISEEDRRQYQALRAEVGSLTAEELAALERLAFLPLWRRILSWLAARARALGRALLALGRSLLRPLLRRSPPAAEAPPPPPPTAGEALRILEKHRRFLTLRPAFDQLQRLEGERQRAEAELSAIEGQLRGILSAAQVAEGGDLEGAIEGFLTACRHRQEYEAALAAAQEAGQRRRVLLQGRSREELERHRQQLQARLQPLLAQRPDLEGAEPDRPAEELAERLQRLQREREEASVRQAGLRAEIDATFKEHRPRAEIEEEIERWQRDVARLERARSAAELARQTIEEAMRSVYRDFAPAVNAFLSHGLAQVTAGRYRRAFVDPATLRVSLEVPEIDQVLSDPPVSHGTSALAYILMRIGLAQHMSSIGEPVPLVLDDPFVDIDGRRLPRLLRFLAGLTERVQILLFSKDEDILRWFQQEAPEPRHRIHRLTAGFPVGLESHPR